MARQSLGRSGSQNLPGARGVMKSFFDRYGICAQYVGMDYGEDSKLVEATFESMVWWNLTDLTQVVSPASSTKSIKLKPGDCVIGGEFVRAGPDYGGPLTLGKREELEKDGEKVFKDHVIPPAESIKVKSKVDAAFYKSRSKPGKKNPKSGDRVGKRAGQIDLGRHKRILEPPLTDEEAA